jgi:hypothetical protein
LEIGQDVRDTFKGLVEICNTFKNFKEKIPDNIYIHLLNSILNLHKFIRKITLNNNHLHTQTWNYVIEKSYTMTLFVFSLLNKQPLDINIAHTFGSIFSVREGAFWIDFERNFKIVDS